MTNNYNLFAQYGIICKKYGIGLPIRLAFCDNFTDDEATKCRIYEGDISELLNIINASELSLTPYQLKEFLKILAAHVNAYNNYINKIISRIPTKE